MYAFVAEDQCLIDWLTALTTTLIDWLIGQTTSLIDWLIGQTTSLIDWLIDIYVIYWLIDWLIGWLAQIKKIPTWILNSIKSTMTPFPHIFSSTMRMSLEGMTKESGTGTRIDRLSNLTINSSRSTDVCATFSRLICRNRVQISE